jgi:Ala-tRNA(Pro) deacylase
MAISLTLLEYLEWENVEYDLLYHEPTYDSQNTAEAANVTGDNLAKCVVLEDENGFIMAVIPATHELDIEVLSQQLDRNLQFASETEIEGLFEDCDVGAVPPLVGAYGYEAVLDETLIDCPDIYMEAGDHTELVRISGHDFQELMTDSQQGYFSHHY